MTPDLPAELKSALARKAEGLSRNDATKRASLISQAYRSGGDSKTIKTETDALAYALVRMPATYAAVAACMTAMIESRPDFAPLSVLDIGAGPGTATWAAAQAFVSLREFTLLDSNISLRQLALELLELYSALKAIDYRQGEAIKQLADAPVTDLVIASYLVGELGAAERANLADAMWAKTRDTLMIVEPGTPAGYARIIELRTRLIAQGAHVVAPCPHEADCPLVAPDWCHFSQRLARSRAHKHLKGAELPFEDEKFSYLVLSRNSNTQHVARVVARVLAQPKISKVAVTLKLCTASGLEIAEVAHRDKTNYSRAKKLDWGDTTAG